MENKNTNTIEIELADGTIARWVIPEDSVDDVTFALEMLLGPADTVKL
jgi:hypothetical protein